MRIPRLRTNDEKWIEFIMQSTGCSEKNARTHMKSLRETMERFQINTPERQTAFLAQLGHESGHLRTTKEGLNYTNPETLYNTFKNNKNMNWKDAEDARTQFYTKDGDKWKFDSEKFFNNAYGGKNGNDAAGDGYKYTGKGLFQTTGKSNYKEFSDYVNKHKAPEEADVDFVKNPELLEKPPYSAMSAGFFWDKHNLNAQADKLDLSKGVDDPDNLAAIKSMTKTINGGHNGLADRKKLWDSARKEANRVGSLELKSLTDQIGSGIKKVEENIKAGSGLRLP